MNRLPLPLDVLSKQKFTLTLHNDSARACKSLGHDVEHFLQGTSVLCLPSFCQMHVVFIALNKIFRTFGIVS